MENFILSKMKILEMVTPLFSWKVNRLYSNASSNLASYLYIDILNLF